MIVVSSTEKKRRKKAELDQKIEKWRWDGGRDSSVSLFILANNPNCSALTLEQFYNYFAKFVRQNCVFEAL